MKKAQMEAMGLAVIVLLVSIGIIFVAVVVSQGPKDFKTQPIHSKMAKNFVDTLLQTTTDCNDLSVQELIEQCHSLRTCESGVLTCDYLKEISGEMLQMVFEERKMNYRFVICNWNFNGKPPGCFSDSIMVEANSQGSCDNREPAIFPLPTSPPTTARLDICS